MIPSTEPDCGEFEIVADIRYSDAVLATLAQFRLRARSGVLAYAVVLVSSIGATWVTGGALFWLPAAVASGGCTVVAAIIWLVRRDFRRSGGKPLRMRFHVCGGGIEIRAAGRGEWVAWEDVWDAGETRRSFLVSPRPGEHYVIPKRYCDSAAVGNLRMRLFQREASVRGALRGM